MSEYTAENIVQAIEAFYSPQVTPQTVQKLNVWLSAAQSSREAWSFSISLLQVHLPAAAQFFGANALFHKLSVDFEQLAFEQHEPLRNCLAQLLRTYASHVHANARRILHRLAASFAVLLIHSVPDFWEGAFSDIERLVRDDQNPSCSITLFLRVAKCIPEQFSTAHFVLERRNEVRGELSRNVLLVISRCVQVLREALVADGNGGLPASRRDAVSHALSCASCWCDQFGLTVAQVNESGLLDVAISAFLHLAATSSGDEDAAATSEADGDPLELSSELLCSVMSLTDLHRYDSILQRIANGCAGTRKLVTDLKTAQLASEDKERRLLQAAKVLSCFVENHSQILLASFTEQCSSASATASASAILETLLDLLVYSDAVSNATPAPNGEDTDSGYDWEIEKFESERSRVELCLSAFFYAADEIRTNESSDKARNSVLFTTVFQSFVDALLQRSRYPRSPVAFRRFLAQPSDVREEFARFRRESISDAYQSAHTVLGSGVLRKLLAYQRTLSDQHAEMLYRTWVDVEAVCFSATSLLAAISSSQYAAHADELYAFIDFVCTIQSRVVQLAPLSVDADWLVHLSMALLDFLGHVAPLFSGTLNDAAEDSQSQLQTKPETCSSREAKIEVVISLLTETLRSELASRSVEARTQVFSALNRTVAGNGAYLRRKADYAFELLRHFTSLTVSNFDWLVRNDLQNARSLAECVGHALSVSLRHVAESRHVCTLIAREREHCVQQTVDSLFVQFAHSAFLESPELAVRVIYVLSGLFTALSGSCSQCENASASLFATLNLLERVSQTCMRVTERHLPTAVGSQSSKNAALHAALVQNINALLLAAIKTVAGSTGIQFTTSAPAFCMPESAVNTVRNVTQIVLHFCALCAASKLSVPEVFAVAHECVATFQHAPNCNPHISRFVNELCAPLVLDENATIASLSPEMLEAFLQFAATLLKTTSMRNALGTDNGILLTNIVRLAIRCLPMNEVQTVKAACKLICEGLLWSEQCGPLYAALSGNAEALHNTLLTAVCGTTPRSFAEYYADVFLALNLAAPFMQALRTWLERNLVAADEQQSAICALVSKPQRVTFVRQLLRERVKRRIKQLLVEFSLKCRGFADTDYAKMTLNTSCE